MKKFTDICSPATWVILFFSIYFGLFILFRPSITEVGLLILVDTILIFPAAIVEQAQFLKRNPDMKAIFPEFQVQHFKNADNDSSLRLLNSLMAFPKIRSKHILFWNLIKVIPAGFIISLYWKHENQSFLGNAERFLQFMAFELIIFTALSGYMFIEFHQLCSRTIAELHHAFNWKDVFRKASLEKPTPEFNTPENIVLIFIAIWWTISAVQLLPKNYSIEIIGIALIAFLFVGRIYFLNRSFYRSGLETIFKTFESYQPGTSEITLPYHSSPLLAQFERTFNQLAEKLRAREKELSEWVDLEVEQSRFRALGEIAGLVVHDLATPLHVAKFCAEEISSQSTSTNPVNFQKLNSYMKLNLDRAQDLIESLRASLKNPAASNNASQLSSSFLESHRYVQQILETQFRSPNGMERIKFDISEDMKNISLGMSRLDLTHILYNLYKNSIQNILEDSNKAGLIQVRFHKMDNIFVQILLADNGSGLSPMRFLQLIGKDTGEANQGNLVKEGLGLRRTNRLIEKIKGKLEIVSDMTHNSTTFLLTLPYAGNEKQNVSDFTELQSFVEAPINSND